MSNSVADFILNRLSLWGVRRIYGYPGNGNMHFLGALERIKDRITFIQTPHNEIASFMACAHAKFTGEVGVCLASSGGSATQLLTGLYDAKMDHQPVVAIVGQQARASMGGDFQQEIDLVSLYKDVASEYVQVAMDPVQVRHLVDRAVRIALAKRTVTCIIIPIDIQEAEAIPAPPQVHGSIHSSLSITKPTILPDAKDLQLAADILNNGRKVAILIGAGAFHASAEITEVAERLGAGVAKALLGKAALPDDLPFVTGSIGLLGTKPSWNMMRDCDTLLMVGTSYPYAEFLPKEGQARAVQIDIDGRMIGIRYPTELNLIGDSATTLRALLPLLHSKEDRSWRQSIEEDIHKWWLDLEAMAMNTANPINPQRVFWELSPRLPDNAIMCLDSGTATLWYARFIKIRQGMMASLSGNLASMGSGVPYAIAAKFAHPDRVAIAMVGDGVMQMQGNSALIAVAKYWQQWTDPRLVVLVLNNCDFSFITWEQRIMSGDPKFRGSQDILDFPYARYAELLGLRGIRVDDPEQLGAAWEEAFAADRPVVLEVYTDPNVPPIPPYITFDQAKGMTSSILKGDPDAFDVIINATKNAIQPYLPRSM